MVKHLVVSVFAVALSTSAFGQAKFSAEQGVLGWMSKTSEEKPDGGDKVKTTETGLGSGTEVSSLKLGANWDKLSIYVYPVGGDWFEVGYFAMDNLEVGARLGLNSSDKKEGEAKSSSATNVFGAWGTYSMPMGSAGLEANFGVTMVSGSSKKPNATTGEDDKTTESNMIIDLGANYVMPLAKNFHWLGGFSYNMGNGETKVGDAKSKSTESTMALNLSTFRWSW